MKTPALPYSLLMAFLVSALLSTSTAVEFDINKYVEQPTEPEIGHEPTPDEAKLPKPTVGEAPAFAIVGEDEYLFLNPESIVDYEPICPQKYADYKSIDLSWKYTEYLEKDEIEPESSSVLD